MPAAPQHQLVASMPVTVPDSPSLRFAVDSLYEKLHLDSMDMSRQAYSFALQGLENLQEEGVVTNDSVLTVIDFSLPSYKKEIIRDRSVEWGIVVQHLCFSWQKFGHRYG